MVKEYEQEVTIVLSAKEATSMRVALQYAAKALNINPEIRNSQPTSLCDFVQTLHYELREIMHGNNNPKITGHCSYKMVKVQS